MAASARSGCQKLIDHRDGGAPILKYRGDSDAHIVRGLVAIVLSLYSGRTPQEILATDAIAVFDEFGFRDHLTPQRSNGLRSMVERIKTDAKEALAEASLEDRYFRFRCCCPSPICLASCERATA